jgi:dipeptide transport system ATP-binding protein
MAMILITHDMGVVAETVTRINVMYAGQVVEKQSVDRLFAHPRHPYTHALLEALPERSRGARRLPTIPGVVPGRYDRPDGCLFHPRCARVADRCRHDTPLPDGENRRMVRCHFPMEDCASD